MRTLIITALFAATGALPAGAEAQRMAGHRAGVPGQWQAPRPAPPMGPSGHQWQGPRPAPSQSPRWGGPGQSHAPRWGGNVGGRWYAGVYAPGGWTSYRRPVRGWQLPAYWFAPSFYISDYAGYGLGVPPSGYNWSRYYDDAVLVDGRGRVYDSVSGIGWDRYDTEVYVDGERVDDAGHADGPPPPPVRRRDDGAGGAGGAVIGGVAGGIAGNVIAGRGNRLAGTVVGAAAGAIAGAAIDRAEDRGHDRRPPPPPPPRYGAPYGQPGGGYVEQGAIDDREPPIAYERREIDRREFRDGYDETVYATRPTTTVIRGPGTVTTVTIVPAVTTTTTTTEYVYESRPVAYRARKVRAWRPKPKPRQCTCVCRTVCR